MGSGSLAAVSILETKYRDDLTLEEAKLLCIEAIEAGIIHDLGSGSNVDICVIKKDSIEY
jgi:20S proteasome subunit beta 2